MFLSALALPLLFAAGNASAQASPDRKMQREIRRMEHDLDDMLVDSSNFLVPGYHNARGMYVPGTGMIFTFSSSLTASRGSAVFSVNKRHWMLWDDDDDEDDDSDKEHRTIHSRGIKREERQYKRGTDEMMDLLLDDADSFSSLRAGEWVQVVAYFNDVDYLWDKDIQHLAVKAKVDDLRAYAAKSLSADQARSKMVKEEY